ncbi:hypothetical protein C8R48DRAFT_731415 [Suillus tomentosus]|nr:hypothetical protein C8R48DRAFT_731415 [Suillus tomentosus]
MAAREWIRSAGQAGIEGDLVPASGSEKRIGDETRTRELRTGTDSVLGRKTKINYQPYLRTGTDLVE